VAKSKTLEVYFQASYSIETPTQRGSSDVVSFDLNSSPYHIMLATGPVDATSKQIQCHTTKGVTLEPVNLAQFNPYIKPNVTTTTSAPTTTTAVTPANDSSIYGGCYDIKGCFGTPAGCVEKRNCNFLASYARISYDYFQFEIGQAVGDSTNSYAALGLSFDDKMGEDSVMACTLAAGSQVNIAMYWNTPSYSSIPLEDPHFGLTEEVGSVEDGLLKCSFKRQAMTRVPEPGTNRSQLFDLRAEKFYLLLAAGKLDSDGLLTKHTATDRSAEPQVNILYI
jgi:hypothetical protein